jgi:large subunit ribosomal protein L13
LVNVIDADGAIVGRLASHVAKRAMEGERFAIVNAEKAIVTGSKAHLVSFYKRKTSFKRQIGGKNFPKRPDRVLKRTIRGMVPRKTYRGRNAISRVRVYMGVPKEFEGKAKKVVSLSKDQLLKFQYLGDVCEEIGWQRK